LWTRLLSSKREKPKKAVFFHFYLFIVINVWFPRKVKVPKQ